MAHDATSIGPGPSTNGIDAVLHKVRSLLAKAESTSFEDEAAAFTAKAQQIMSRHAIDRAMVADGGRGPRIRPGERTIDLEAPYAREKYLLLSAVSGANDVRAVYDPNIPAGILIGFDDDLRAVELLFTSLLVQATSAMLGHGRDAATRRRRYRQSFLIAYASRVGERLRAARDAEVAGADADRGGGVLPVLASRRAEVDVAVVERFGDLRSTSVTIRDRAGWEHGTVAGTRADLGTGGVVAGGRRRFLGR